MSENWTNEIILEFLKIYQSYPVIWDSQNMNHKNRNIVAEAWIEIKKKISISCTVDTLKKKKESLMSTYRSLKKKVLESKKSGTEEIYKPSWFAFPVMDKFLKNVGKLRPTIKTEGPESNDLTEIAENKERTELTTKEIIVSTHTPVNDNSKRKGGPFEINTKKGRVTLQTESQKTNHRSHDEPDEYTLYGQLIASKLRNMNKRSRLIVINQIDNLIFQNQMEEMDNAPLNVLPIQYPSTYLSQAYTSSQPSPTFSATQSEAHFSSQLSPTVNDSVISPSSNIDS